MSSSNDNTSASIPNGDESHLTFQSGTKSPAVQPSKSSPNMAEGETEKFPLLAPNSKSNQKSRSLTQAEINMGVITEDEVAALSERLQTDPPPMSLQEARERRASIKEERKRSIDFIRSRTNSRAAAMGRPSLDALTEGERKD